MLLAAPSLALLALRAPAFAIAAAELLYGIAGGFFVGVWPTILQTHVPPRVLARVSAWDWVGTFAFLPLGYALAGPLSDALGVDTLLWIGVAWVLVSVPAVLSVPAVRTLTWRPHRKNDGLDVADPT